MEGDDEVSASDKLILFMVLIIYTVLVCALVWSIYEIATSYDKPMVIYSQIIATDSQVKCYSNGMIVNCSEIGDTYG